jgi:hypothetical protein
MQRRDPAKAVQVLDLVLEFFGNGHRWRRYRLRDSEGNRCLAGALGHVRRAHRISGDGARYYLMKAIYPDLGIPVPVEMFNDDCETYDQVKQVIIEARALAAADLVQEHQPARLAA